MPSECRQQAAEWDLRWLGICGAVTLRLSVVAPTPLRSSPQERGQVKARDPGLLSPLEAPTDQRPWSSTNSAEVTSKSLLDFNQEKQGIKLTAVHIGHLLTPSYGFREVSAYTQEQAETPSHSKSQAPNSRKKVDRQGSNARLNLRSKEWHPARVACFSLKVGRNGQRGQRPGVFNRRFCQLPPNVPVHRNPEGFSLQAPALCCCAHVQVRFSGRARGAHGGAGEGKR